MDGLITLADVPELKGADPKPRARIVIGRLDDNLRDPRYGKFAITQRQVDGWKRNLSETFGGQVSMDFDHSSDRGNGTKAACWITGIDQDGPLIVADVQFTRRGAKAVRNGDYKYTSPTFVENYVDEHGVKHGPALIGGALTNRPVLRLGMPTLSLSRDHLEGVAVLSNLKQKEPTVSKKRKWETMVLGKDGQLKTKMLSRKGLIKEARRSRERSSPAFEKWVERERSLASSRPGVDAVITLAQYAPAGVAHAGTVDWSPPNGGAFRQPPGLDDAGVALHGLIADRARRTGEPYFEAMANVTGIPDYRKLSDLPTTPVHQQGLDPERMAIDNAARALAASAGISWLDACNYLMEPAGDLGDGSAAVPWLDSRPVSPPRPWSDDDWQRDKRRARAAGIQVGADGADGEDNQLKSLWLAAAEQGHDIVGEMAEQQRADAIATREARQEGFLDQARAAEDNRRSGAINDELTRRARNRVAAPGRAAARRLPGASGF